MTSGTKHIGQKTSSMRLPRAASPQAIGLLDGFWEQVEEMAFELWQARPYRAGHELEDWLDAAAIVMGEIHEARE